MSNYAGAPSRLRPIFMTTLTTVLGLIPLALGIGEGAEMQAPLAIVVIFGLSRLDHLYPAAGTGHVHVLG